MTLLAVVFSISVLCDLLFWTPYKRRVWAVIAFVGLAATAFASGALLASKPGVPSIFLFMFGVYRMFNQVRVVYGRMHEAYLRRAVRHTATTLLAMQAAVIVLWWAWLRWQPDAPLLWQLLTGAQVVVAAVFLASIIRRLQRTTWPRHLPHLSDKELPTVSVAIPARNETEALETCLESVIASDYPKLEVLVLDDCSQTKRTPEIIRSFAHAGVRFVQGKTPNDTWLPKNRAYQQLMDEASGDYIVFLGVDVQLAPGSIRQLVAALKQKKKQMMSILPRGSAFTQGRLALAQTMRYWWEVVPPRRWFGRPPVLSSCWIIAADALQAAGGFAAATRSVVPEAYFARQLLKQDAYSFMRSDLHLGITSNKSAAEQRTTAIRLRYPQVHRRPENVCALTLFQSAFLVLPFVLGITGWWLRIGALASTLALGAAAMVSLVCILLAHSTRVLRAEYSFALVPVMALYDLAILHYSMWRYEFASVDWKGRNICVPAMHVTPRLPSVPEP
ncbi:MAG TPA: glycosyltransferase family 2 protein [Candidatus Saccharimonadales bacterium]|nr:glycosyltransferase family 2 protein [Candidatus Saccharimonadales bacterium]